MRDYDESISSVRGERRESLRTLHTLSFSEAFNDVVCIPDTFSAPLRPRLSSPFLISGSVYTQLESLLKRLHVFRKDVTNERSLRMQRPADFHMETKKWLREKAEARLPFHSFVVSPRKPRFGDAGMES